MIFCYFSLFLRHGGIPLYVVIRICRYTVTPYFQPHNYQADAVFPIWGHHESPCGVVVHHIICVPLQIGPLSTLPADAIVFHIPIWASLVDGHICYASDFGKRYVSNSSRPTLLQPKMSKYNQIISHMKDLKINKLHKIQ